MTGQTTRHLDGVRTGRVQDGGWHRALARSSLLRDWFPCAGAVLSLSQTHRGGPQTTSTWLQSPSAVILEPPKIKSDTVSPSTGLQSQTRLSVHTGGPNYLPSPPHPILQISLQSGLLLPLSSPSPLLGMALAPRTPGVSEMPPGTTPHLPGRNC